MLSLLLIRTFLFLTILTTSCTAFLSIKVVKEKDNFQKSSKNGGFDFSHSCSNFSERAVIVNRTLKCVPENDIISTVKATDEMQETYHCELIRFGETNAYSFGSFKPYQKSTPLYRLNYDERSSTTHPNMTRCMRLKVTHTIPKVFSILKNTCDKLDPGVLYFVTFQALNVDTKKNKTFCQIFTVSGVITDSEVKVEKTKVSATNSMNDGKVTATVVATTANTTSTTTTELANTTGTRTTEPADKKTNTTTENAETTTNTTTESTDTITTAITEARYTRTTVTTKSGDVATTTITELTTTTTEPAEMTTSVITELTYTRTPTITKPASTVLAVQMKNTTVGPASPPGSKFSDYLLYAVIAGCVVLVLLIVGLLYCLCRRKKSSNQDVELDMEELYAKPIKKKRKRLSKTTAPEHERKLLPGYDEVGTIVAGTYERRDSYGSDTDLINNSSDRPNSVKLDFLKNAGTQDDPYEVIGSASSFKAGFKRESNLPILQLRSDTENNVTEGSQESINKTDSAVTFKPDDKNGGIKGLSSFKQGSSIRQQRTSIRRGRLDNNPVFENVKITPPVSRDGSPLPTVRTEKEKISPADQNKNDCEDKRNCKSNSYDNVKELNLSNSNDLTKSKDKSHSYKEIWNEEPTKTQILQNSAKLNSHGNCLDSPYESITNTNNEIRRSKDDLQTNFPKTENKIKLEQSKNENDTDSGYEEISSHRKNSADNNIEADYA